MRFSDSARLTLQHIRQSVHTHYGKGAYNFFRFFYYSLFRINTFIVFVWDSRYIFDNRQMDPRLLVIRQDFEKLNHFRRLKDLPREFYCDINFGIKDFFWGIWDENPAYIHWAFPAGSKSRFLCLGQRCAEINYMLTLPDFRGNRICSQVIGYTIHRLADEGVQKIFCVVHTQNITSIKALQRAGFKKFKKVKSVGPFNLRMEVSVS